MLSYGQVFMALIIAMAAAPTPAYCSLPHVAVDTGKRGLTSPAALVGPLVPIRHSGRQLLQHGECSGGKLDRTKSFVTAATPSDESNLVLIKGLFWGGGFDKAAADKYHVSVTQKLADGGKHTMAVDTECGTDADCNYACEAEFPATMFESSSSTDSIDIPFSVYLTESQQVQGATEHYHMRGKDYVYLVLKRVDGSTYTEVVNELKNTTVVADSVTEVSDETKLLGDVATFTARSSLKGFILDPTTMSAQYVLRSPSGDETLPKDLMVGGESIRMEASATATKDRRGITFVFNIKEDANPSGTGDMDPPFWFDVFWQAEQVAGQRRSGQPERATGMTSFFVEALVPVDRNPSLVATAPPVSMITAGGPVPTLQGAACNPAKEGVVHWIMLGMVSVGLVCTAATVVGVWHIKSNLKKAQESHVFSQRWKAPAFPLEGVVSAA